MRPGRRFRASLTALLVFVLTGCSVLRSVPDSAPLETAQPWVILPFFNLAQSPQAAERVEAITAALLRTRGLQILEPPADSERSPLHLTQDSARLNKALNWAKQQPATLGVSGSVNEWRYKAGLDGEPAVGITLRVIDLKSGQVVWTATGARSGWGREGVAMAAQTVLDDLLDDLPLSTD